jgi:hypothetical protein
LIYSTPRGGDLDPDLGNREAALGEHCGTSGDDERHAQRRHDDRQPPKAVADSVIDRDREAGDDETDDGEKIHEHSTLGEEGAALVPFELSEE